MIFRIMNNMPSQYKFMSFMILMFIMYVARQIVDTTSKEYNDNNFEVNRYRSNHPLASKNILDTWTQLTYCYNRHANNKHGYQKDNVTWKKSINRTK
jgi:hypothetical protein